jgi:hypothetical protein
MAAETDVEIAEYALALQPARLHHRQDALDQAAAVFAPAAETPPLPHDCAAQQLFQEVLVGSSAGSAR